MFMPLTCRSRLALPGYLHNAFSVRPTLRIGSGRRVTRDHRAERLLHALSEKFNSCGTAKVELFDHIEVFYNQRHRHSTLVQISPAEFERRGQVRQAA
jgi:hypothetical protein